MAENYLTVNRNSPFQSLLQGFGAGQSIIGNINQNRSLQQKNQLMQMEMEKQKAVKNALANYGQEGFDEATAIKAVMPHDPELGIKIKDTMRKSTKEQIEMMAAGAKLGEQMAPALIDNPAGYHAFQQKMQGMGVTMIPPIQTFMTQDGQIDIARMNETAKRIGAGSGMFLEEYKMGMKPPEKRTVQVGDQNVEQQWDPVNRRFVAIGGGPKWNDNPLATITRENPTTGEIETVQVGGKPGGKTTHTGVQPKTQGEIEDKLFKATGLLSQLDGMKKTYEPVLQEYGTKLGVAWTGMKSGLGMNLSEKEMEIATKMYTHRSKSMEYLNSLIKEISGATVTDQEAARLKAQLPTAGTGVISGDIPLEFKTKLDTTINSVQKSIVRLNYLRKAGFSIRNNKELEEAINKTGITIDKMDMAVKRGKELKAEGKTDDQIKQTLAKEFGWVF